MESRIELPTAHDMDPRQHAIYQSVLETRGNADGPFLAWLHSPGLAGPAQQLGAFCRYDTELSLIESEMLILCVAAHFQCVGEQQIHEPIAIKAGLSAETVATLRVGGWAYFESNRIAMLQRLARQLLDQHRIDDETFQAAQQTLGTQALVEVVGVIGYYSLVAMTLNAFDMRLAGVDPA
ncbi:carboxymuconolactone decarboxylase family protein [Halomonas alkalisoli]|uniref:carboxymuconolactone decarboxylase family protein n=1 Tax=Halomonas alkalisoli TaxID=2907158 RepID=UPI001F2EF37E|nr:carboxymuconolactone decarboxylase family protein [Halomonas alkalisoli]MCE9681521.1 carboxymuconolactone decarboxylase family protein [Halomonas alkalisoli]